MIVGVGVDMVRVERMERPLSRFGERFAAKEAAAKALGTGFRDGLVLADIEVTRDSLGKPGLAFGGRAAERAAALGVAAAHLSLSDERDYAVAFVVLESR